VQTDLTVDVVGYATGPQGTDFTVDVVGYVTGPASPAGENGLFRVLPSPVSVLNGPTAAGQSHLVNVAGSGGVVDTLSMVTGVVSLQNTSGVRQFATVEAANASGVPTVSSVNVGPNERLAGYATSRVSNGQVRVYASGPGTVTFDVVGYYVSVLSMGPQDQYRGPSGYTWNAEQHLASTTAPDGVTTYSYDAGGQRVALRSPSGEVTYSLGAMEATRTGGGWVRVRRSYAHAGVPVASRELGVGGDRLSWLLGNHQGSVTTTVTGGVVSTRAYAPYGGRRGPLPVERPTSTGFVGQREDVSSGLSYLNARYHDPVTGSFVSVDPLVAKTGEPYLYASGNPITLSDPTGLEPGCGATSYERSSCADAREAARKSNPRGRSSETTRGRRSDSGDGSNAGWDWAGEALFHHYVFGGGDRLWMVDEENGSWARYMNDVVFGYIRTGEAPSQLDYSNGAYSWDEIVAWHDFSVVESLAGRPAWNAAFPVATINGDGMVGAQFLHGTNADVGGSQIVPPSISSVSLDADGNTVAEVTMRYAWNDKIDPNPIYSTDQQKESIAERVGGVVPVVDPTGYSLRIEWTSTVNYVISPSGQVLSRSGGILGG
jgi:RHS repeat-associated protein